MALARLVVLEGPDLGAEFDIPLRGGGIGRDPDSLVALSDMAVSRAHCSVEFRNGTLVLIDGGSRNRTLVNGQPITVHALREGDEIVVGKTRLAYLPRSEAMEAARPSRHAGITMEMGSRELWQVAMPGARPGAQPGPQLAARDRGDDRARRHLASLARLGDRLRAIEERDALIRAACDAARDALAARRALMLLRDPGGRLVPMAAAVDAAAGSPGPATEVALTRPVLAKVMAEGKAVALDGEQGPAVAAPLFGVVGRGAGGGDAPIGLLFADRGVAQAAAWDAIDVMAASCLAHVISAALAGHEAREGLARENQALTEQLAEQDEQRDARALVGTSPPMQAVRSFVAKVGPSDATILLTGESGSGKEMVARAIHRASRRSQAPFIAVNCAALTETLIESELFGHEKGAFTGAAERKLGRFELASGGTLFLDEVGELPPNCQTKFLRVLEEQVFERVGGGRSISVDVRVVAATNRDLPAMIRRGQFRDDLYYRLSVIHTVVPPLRARPDDIPALAEHFLARLRNGVARRVRGFDAAAMQALMAYPWPGNVRELRNAVERAIVLGDGPWILPAHLPPDVSGFAAGAAAMPMAAAPAAMPAGPSMPDAATIHSPYPGTAAPSMPASAPRALRDLEREAIAAALQATGGNKVQAAAILQIDRSTLYKKIKDYGIGE